MKEHRGHSEVAQVAGAGEKLGLSWLGVHMEQWDRRADLLIARIASRAHGLVTRKTLLGKGVSPQQVRRRLERGSLIAVHRGVYRVGHQAPSIEARYLAAVLACGERAFLSALPAAYLWGLIKGPAPAPEVTCPNERRVVGIRTRRARPFHPEDATRCRGIPVTSVPRTLVDLARVLPERELARACHEAEVRYETTPDQVEALLSRLPNAPGARVLRRVLHGEVPVTLSRLETVFLRRLQTAGLPLPRTNHPAGGRRVDCRWPEQRLTIELDSYRYHHSRHAWEADRRREREAYARGDEFRRYTWADVAEAPRLMLKELRSLLRRNPA
jgi:predicted transcriptional regulator of viral defense system